MNPCPRPRAPGAIAVVLAVALGAGGGACRGASEPAPAGPAAAAVAPAAVVPATAPSPSPASACAAGDLGVEVLGLRATAGGGMLDLRYRVTTPACAAPLVARSAELALVDAASGARLVVPRTGKTGPLRTSAQAPVEGRTHFVLFDNRPGLARGATVTLLLDGRPIRDLRVD